MSHPLFIPIAVTLVQAIISHAPSLLLSSPLCKCCPQGNPVETEDLSLLFKNPSGASPASQVKVKIRVFLKVSPLRSGPLWTAYISHPLSWLSSNRAGSLCPRKCQECFCFWTLALNWDSAWLIQIISQTSLGWDIAFFVVHLPHRTVCSMRAGMLPVLFHAVYPGPRCLTDTLDRHSGYIYLMSACLACSTFFLFCVAFLVRFLSLV